MLICKSSNIYLFQNQIAGVQIIVLAIGENLNELELKGIASRPDAVNYFSIPSWTDLEDTIDELFDAHYNSKINS